MNNDPFAPGTDAQSATQHDSGSARRPVSVHLTPREAEIVRYVLLGESNKQIARRLGISNYTVRDHVSNLLKKSGVTSRTRLALVLPAPSIHQTSGGIHSGTGSVGGVNRPTIDLRQSAGPEASRAAGALWRK